MARYAQFDPTTKQVIGWYDTDLVQYAMLPPRSQLVELTNEQWNARMSDPSGWVVQDSKLVHVPGSNVIG